MATTAFCPAYVTGIFSIGDNDSAGAGFAINKGLTTTVSQLKSGTTRITINGSETPAPVSKAVLRRYLELGCRSGILDISHKAEVPIGYGLGMSAAGALSLSLALNELLNAGLSREKCVKIAHDADAECGTGLSGVDAAAIGGALCRKSVKDRPVKLDIGEQPVHLAFFSPIKTASIIRNSEWKEKVNAAGDAALARLEAEPGWDALLSCSREFSEKSGLAGWCAPIMRHNERAGMAMLGHTLFSDRPFLHLGRVMMQMETTTCQKGAMLM